MSIAAGVFKKLSAKKQVGLGTIAPAGASGTAGYKRRKSSDINLTKASYESNEINPSQQISDMRHGVRAVSGSINAEISCGSYYDFDESLLRAASSSAITSGALTDVTSAVTVGAAGTLTRGSGSWITDGFKVGMVVRISGYASPATANNAHNALITALTATVMTILMLDAVPLVAKSSGDSVTIAEVGEHIVMADSAHTRDYWTIEHWHADVAQSHVYKDCVIAKKSIQLPATGMAEMTYDVMGLDMVTGTSEYFTSPAAASNTGSLAAVNGLLMIGGVKVALLTSLNYEIDGQFSVPGGIVGSNTDPDVFPGVMKVTGSAEVLFENATMRDNFLNEVEVSLIAVLTASNAANADFQSHVFPCIKTNSFTLDDNPQSLKASVSFQALRKVIATNQFYTSFWIQDSQAPA